MDSQTVTLIERPYLEIVDDILTAIVGGVVNEPIIFDVKIDSYPLAEQAEDVRSITGTISQNGDSIHHVFQKEVDYIYNSDDNTIIWQEDATLPEDETTFFVDYFRPESNSPSPLNDINVGSVTRTLSEAIGREIATVYQQINQAYLSAFVDTATGKSLDLVVSILGIKRHTKDYEVGRVTFFRDPSVSGNITIPQGTVLAKTKGEATYQTTQPRTLQQGQVRIDIPIRATDDFKGEAGHANAGEITEMALPIAGIGQVSNFDATFLGAEDENDEELRLRAKAILRALGKGTLAALSLAIFEERANLVESWDPNGPPSARTDPGELMLLVETEPESFPSLQAAVEQTRAAGIQTTLLARYIYFKPRIVVTIKSGVTAAGKEKLEQEIIASLQSYVDGLTSGDSASGEALLEAIKNADTQIIKEVRIVDIISWQTDVSQPAAETLVDVIMEALTTAPSEDTEAQRAAINEVISGESPVLMPTGRRVVNRDLVQGESGARATDDELESGAFNIVAVIDGENWWLVLDMEPADILLEEAS